ncbi:unnamed protein product [Linum tenue]|uniref:Uncharacterized protein n=1 Tax=Linum tenue TaxID=586396 RepID=A0AAV0RR36_9ROSI|nr:unnamed protein product [Linum tenue]
MNVNCHVLLDCFCSSNLVAALLVPLRVWITAFESLSLSLAYLFQI